MLISTWLSMFSSQCVSTHTPLNNHVPHQFAMRNMKMQLSPFLFDWGKQGIKKKVLKRSLFNSYLIGAKNVSSYKVLKRSFQMPMQMEVFLRTLVASWKWWVVLWGVMPQPHDGSRRIPENRSKAGGVYDISYLIVNRLLHGVREGPLTCT